MNEVVIPLKIQGIAQMKAELRELKGSIASATDPAQMAALAQQAGVLSDKIKDANDAVAVFASGSKFEQVSNGLGGIKDSLMSLDFEEAAEKSKTFATALGTINKADIAKSIMGMVSTIGTLSKAFIKLGITILTNPVFQIAAVIVAIIAVVALVLKSFGVLDDVIKALMAPIKALIQGFKDLTDWLGLTAFAAEENAEKTLAANEKVTKSSEERTARVTGDLGREIAEAKAAGKDTTKLEEELSNTKIKEANKRKQSAKEALDAQKKLGDDADIKKIEDLKKQVAKENEIIKQGYSDKIVAKNTADKKESDDADKKEKEASDKAKVARDKRIAADKASEADIAAAAKVVSDSKKTAQQIELDDLKAAYAIKIAEATKHKNDTTALLQAQKIQEADITKKYADAAKAIQDEKDAKKKEADAKAIADAIALEDFKYNEIQRLAAETETDAQQKILKDAEYKKLIEQQAFEAKTAKLKEDDELYLLYKAEFQAKLDAIDTEALDKTKALEAAKRAEQFATIQQGLDAAKQGLSAIEGLNSLVLDNKLKGVQKGSKEEEKIMRKQFKLNKAMQLAGAVIDAGKAITASLAAAPVAIGVLPNPAGIASLAFAAITSATNIAKIAGTQFTSSSAPSADTPGNIGGGGESTTAVAPAAGPQLFGQANTGSQVNAGGGTNNITVTAVVSETEITSSQNHINNIQQNSVL
jgi:hypothetical protein